MNIRPAKNHDDNSLEANWDLVNRSRKQLANKINLIADSVVGTRRQQLHSVARWLNSSGGYQDILSRPDVISFCMPWVEALKAKGGNSELSDKESDEVVREGFCQFCCEAPEPRSLAPFIYPACALFFGVVVLGFASFTILPTFEQMFAEFGIELPRATLLTFYLGRLVRKFLWLGVAVLAIASVSAWFFTRLEQRQSAYSRSWLDRLLATTRPAVAIWTGHLASLLNAGVLEETAVNIASDNSPLRLLRSTTVEDQRYSSNGWLESQKFTLVSRTLSIQNQPAKIAMLKEVAAYYRSISQTISGWWMKFFAQIIVWGIMGAILFTVASLFMPLISVISGLTGGF